MENAAADEEDEQKRGEDEMIALSFLTDAGADVQFACSVRGHAGILEAVVAQDKHIGHWRSDSNVREPDSVHGRWAVHWQRCLVAHRAPWQVAR